MKKFRILFLTGLSIVTFPITMLIIAYTWNLSSDYVKSDKNKYSDSIVYDTIEVKKTIVDTVRIKIYEKIPQSDTKRIEHQVAPIKDTLKPE